MTKRRCHVVFLLSLLCLLSLGFPATISVQETPEPKPAATVWSGNFAEGWKEFEKKIEEQKFEAASSLIEQMLDSARAGKNNAEWTRCLINYTQLRIGLHGYETSVRFLKDQPWPDDLMGSSVLNLYYAQALVTYARNYSWEIRNRERMDTKGEVDLKAWTRDQIYEEAQKAFENVWKIRRELGALPNTEWKEYLTPNNYPAGIRPTLRDSVSYLIIDMLADTNGWSPEQLNEIYRLNLKNLVNGEVDEISLVDPARHPLEKICFVLADLENWHTQMREMGAALEALLERFRKLYAHFTDVEDKKFIQNDLEKHLTSFTDIPWWSEGIAQLAEFVRTENEPDALIRAHEIALKGRTAFPDSIGGRHCLAIEKVIEAPYYSISGMQIDNPQKRSVLVTHKNLKKIFFRAYSIDLLKTIEANNDFSLMPSGRDLESLIASNSPVQQWEVQLAATPDYRTHKTFIIPPMKQYGTYLVIASGRPGFQQEDNMLQGMYLTISDLVLVVRNEDGEAEVTVLAGSTGKPVRGAEVMRYRLDYRRSHDLVESKQSDESGIVHFSDRSNSRFCIVARIGNQVVYDPQYIYFRNPYSQTQSSTTLLFTDRSIYRPRQKLFWKAVAYSRWSDKTNFTTIQNTMLTISLLDVNRQVVQSKTMMTNSFGTASGEFVIPSGRALGQWNVVSSSGALENGRTNVRVEEYKRPTFEVKMLDPEEPLRLNHPAHMKGEAKYYFGLPVTNGEVNWQVTREPVYPWWWRYYWWGDSGYRSNRSQSVSSGKTSLKEDGTFDINFSPEADERLAKNKRVTYRYGVFVEVTDEGGETRNEQQWFNLGFVSVQASAHMDNAFFLKDDPINIRVLRSNLDGVPKAGKGNWRIVSLKQPSETLLPAQQPLFIPDEFKKEKGYQTPGDSERERWNHEYDPEAVLLQWEEGSTQASGTVTHDEKGWGNIEFAKLPPGAHRLIYETVDDFGEKFELEKNFVVAASSLSLRLPAIFEVEKHSVKVGDKARVLVHSGLKDQLMVFEIYRNAKCVQRKEFRSGVDPSFVEIPITEEDRGGLGLTMTLVRDNQFIQFQRSLMVPWDNKELKVQFSTFRDRLRPGQEETWSVKVTGPAGKEIGVPAAELLAYMYDKSLDALSPHSPVNPIGLYPHRDRSIWARSNLAPSYHVRLSSSGFKRGPAAPILRKDQLLFYSGYGIGGVGRGRGFGVPGGVQGDLVTPLAAAPMVLAEAGSVDEMRADKKAEAEMAFIAPTEIPTETISPVELRSDFSETAFWYPHLLTDADGSVTFEFKVPDSVTSWNVWVHAITRDFKSGYVNKEARSVKELMVRPYLPRFLREGDQAQIKVVVNNASDKELEGSLDFDIIDVTTDQSVLSQFGLSKSDASGKSFTVPANGGTNLAFPIKTPSEVGQIAFKVTATSGDFSDGELRPIPILPGRIHLMQSRFITMKDQMKRVMRFEDLARNDDPTRINEQMVVTLDAQLFYSVLSALPYLVNYPYECTEQTLNRFVSTGILSSMYQQYPAVERMAKEFSSRETQYEQWDAADPNRKMMLEETPWLQMAQGGKEDASDLINVLDSRIAKAQRESALAKLGRSQTSSGGFPWFPGGPPSPYMTGYILYGFSKALEFDVEIPREMVKPAWDYMHRHYLDDVVKDMVKNDSGWQFVTFINYVLSNYPDESWYKDTFTAAERKTMLDFSFKHWKQHSPYLKGYLALTLKRMGRAGDAMLVWESVMDSARTAEDQGTFWAPEDRSWLWYNDTIETHAFAIRTDMELIPEDPKLDGMVLWIFLNKKLNHWKSTRATAEVIYSLAHYLKKTGQLGIREDAAVTVGNQRTTFVFEPDRYTGKKNQIVIPGDKIDPATTSTITVEKTSQGQLFASATWHFSTEKLPEEERGDYLRVSRSYYKRVNTGKEFVLQPLEEGAALAPGDEVEVHLSLASKHPMEYVHLRDPRGAGFEPVTNISRHKWDLGIMWYEEIRDSGTNFFFEHVPQGEYTFKYRIRAATAGTFKVAPATVQPMYAPEFTAYSTGATLKIAALN